MLAVGPPWPYFSNFWCAMAMTCLWGPWVRFKGEGVWVTKKQRELLKVTAKEHSPMNPDPSPKAVSNLMGTDLSSTFQYVSWPCTPGLRLQTNKDGTGWVRLSGHVFMWISMYVWVGLGAVKRDPKGKQQFPNLQMVKTCLGELVNSQASYVCESLLLRPHTWLFGNTLFWCHFTVFFPVAYSFRLW